jgi:hypothetical protein
MEMKMANETQQPQKRLTLDDPIGKEALEKLGELEQAEVNASLQLMAIKQEEVKLLAVGRRVDDERHRIFEKLLMERGLPPNAPATIDSTTGKISLVRPPGPPAPPGPVPHPAVAVPPQPPPPVAPNGQS